MESAERQHVADHAQRLCTIEEIPPQSGLQVKLAGRKPVAVFKLNADIFVVDDLCTHNGASLTKYGDLDGKTVTCGWHGCQFDLASGEVLDGPCSKALTCYRY